MFQTTRRRLALWYTTVTAVLLLLFASGVFLYVRSTLIERIDDTLNHVVEVVRRSLVIEPITLHSEGGLLRVNIETSFRDNAATSEDDRIDIEWFSPTGELQWSTFAEPLEVPLHLNPKGETVRVQKEKGTPLPLRSSPAPPLRSSPVSADPLVLRQITQRVEIGRQVLGYLRVSHPWFEVTKPSRELFFDLAFGIGIAVAAVGAIGWFLSGLAMQPIDEAYQRLKQFTADASHELRSPIAVIQTNVQVALADPDPTPESQQYHLRVVERLTRRLGRLVDDLLFLARQDSGMVQPRWAAIALDTLLTEVIEEQQAIAADKSIPITLTLIDPVPKDQPDGTDPPGLPMLIPATTKQRVIATQPAIAQDSWVRLKGDRDQLARLFTNLVSNAVQYTPAHGKISIDLQRLGRSGNSSLQVRLIDTGIGIPPEAIPQLFDRFYRVDTARSYATAAGSGLGLAIAQAIVHNHQGHIHLDSKPNVGTTVTVVLPQREDS